MIHDSRSAQTRFRGIVTQQVRDHGIEVIGGSRHLGTRIVQQQQLRIPSEAMSTGKVIFLNGSSSAGKTTLAIMLQQLLDEASATVQAEQEMLVTQSQALSAIVVQAFG